MKNKKIQYIKEHLFPHEHSKFLLGAIVALFILFSVFGAIYFQGQLSNMMGSQLKAQLFDTSSDGSFQMDIVDNVHVIDGFAEIPISILGSVPEATPITTMYIGLSGIPDYFSTLETIVNSDISPDASTNLTGQPDPIPSNGEFMINATQLDFAGDSSELTEYIVVKLEVGSAAEAGTLKFDYIMVTGGADGAYTSATDHTVTIDPNPPTPAPSASTVNNPTNVGPTSFDITWSAPANTVNYDVYIDTDSNVADGTKTTQTGTSKSFTGLTASGTYYVGVVAKNATGDSPMSAIKTVQLLQPPAAPVINEDTTTAASDAITLKWSGGTGATGFSLYKDNTYTASVASTATQYQFTGLSEDTDYELKVTAYNAAGDNSDTFTVRTAIGLRAPGAPVLGTPTKTNNSITLSWTAGSGDAADEYKLYIDTDNDPSDQTPVTQTTLSKTFSGLLPVTTYTIGVIATNAAGDSDMSTISVTTESAFSVTGVSFSGQGDGTVNEFYGNIGNIITAAITTSSASTYQYEFHWTCTPVAGSTGQCPEPKNVAYQSSNQNSITVTGNSWDHTNWVVNVSVKDTATGEEHTGGPYTFKLVNKAPVLTFASVTPTSIGTVSEGTAIDDMFYIEQDGSLVIRLNIIDDDNPLSYSVTPDTNALADIAITSSQIVVTVDPMDNGDVTTDASGNVIPGKSAKHIVFTLNDGDSSDMGTSTVDLSFHVVNKNDAPTLTTSNSSPITFSVENTQTKSILATDPDYGDTLTFGLANVSPELTAAGFMINTSTGQFVWATNRPDYDDRGTYSANVTVTDAAGLTDSKVYQIVITADNRDPVINWGTTTSYTANEDGEILVSLVNKASDPDGDSFTWSVEGGTEPANNPNLISTYNVDNSTGVQKVTFVPSANEFGIANSVVLRVTDSNGGYTEQVISLEWTSVNDPISFTEPLANVFENYSTRNEDEIIHLPLTAGIVTDPDDPTNANFTDLEWSVPLTNPSFAVSSFVITDSSIDFIPTENANGIVTVTIEVSDGEFTDSDTVSLKWSSMIDSPTWISWPGQDDVTTTAYAGQNFRFDMTASVDDPDLDTYAYNRDTLSNTTHTAGEINFTVPNSVEKSGYDGHYWFNWTPEANDKGHEHYFNVIAINPYDNAQVSQEVTIYVSEEDAVNPVINTGNIVTTSPTTLELVSNTPLSIDSAELLSNYASQTTGFSIIGVELGFDETTITLTTTEQVSNEEYVIQVSGLESTLGMPQLNTQTLTFTGYREPGVAVVSAEAIDENTLEVIFDGDLDTINAFGGSVMLMPNNYVIKVYGSNDTLSISSAQVATSSISLHTVSALSLQNYTLDLGRIIAVDGGEREYDAITVAGYTDAEVTYDIDIVGVTALSSTAVEVEFNYPIAVSSIDIAINELDGGGGVEALAATLGSTDEKLLIDTEIQDDEDYEIIITGIESVDGLHAVPEDGVTGTFAGIEGSEGNSLGDCNANGSKELNDAIMALKYIVGLNQDYASSIMANCDITGSTPRVADGNISTLDVIEIYKEYKNQ